MAKELDALAAATREQRAVESAARGEAVASRRELDDKRDALARLRAETDRAARGSAEYEARERALRLAVVDAARALREKQAGVTAAATASREAAAAEAALSAQYQRAGAAAALAARQQTAAAREVSGTLDVLQGQLTVLRNIAGAVLGGSLIGGLARDLGETADSYANLAARIKIATGEGAAFDSTFRDVFEVAQRTGTAVEDVGALVVKLSQAGRELNLTSTDALRLAESVAQATQLSGASAQEAAAAVTQFSQAIASGRLQGDELRSLLENSPRLARALADGLGVAVGQLKELGAAGSLTSAQVVAALQGQSAALQREFDSLPLTVGRALTNLSSAWTQYVGQADAASGASKTAAAAIGALAANLDTVAGLLFGLGKSAAAYAALRLAESFIATATATAAATAATVANTGATVANTAAQAANAAATGGTVAAAGRLAGVLSTLKTFSFLAVLTNLESIGTAIGVGAARLLGYGKAIEEVEAQTKRQEAAARASAAALAAQAQAAEQATDKALGLDKQSKSLTATFDGLILKGESTADALAKITKELDLSDVRGIATAGAALDALAVRGKITADALRDTLGAALKGEDLARFEANARAAFDGSEQGVRRLQAALDALADESLKRAGTSARELASGFSAASTSAINDLDALARTLRDLKAPADEASRALAASLDKALAAANTERAVRAVIERLTDLGRAGTLAGDAMAAGLDKAQKKLDELRPGVNSLSEALRTFGLQTREELTATATRLGEAYARIAGSAEVSLAQQIEAFGKYRAAALEASGGVESGQLKLQRVILENRAEVAGLGDALAAAMNKGKTATDEAAKALEAYLKLARADPGRLVGGDGLAGFGGGAPKPSAAPPALGSGGGAGGTPNAAPAPPRLAGGAQLRPPDDSGQWEFISDATYSGGPNTQADIYSAGIRGAEVPRGSVNGVGYWRPKGGGFGVTAQPFGRAPAPAPAGIGSDPSGVGLASSRELLGRYEVTFVARGQTSTLSTPNKDEAEAFIRMLQESLKQAGG
jgi:tape measure domain-containing protein